VGPQRTAHPQRAFQAHHQDSSNVEATITEYKDREKATEKYREDPPCNFLYKIATVKLGNMVRFRALLCFRGTYPVSTFAIL
jgi:hypothetical protein